MRAVHQVVGEGPVRGLFLPSKQSLQPDTAISLSPKCADGAVERQKVLPVAVGRGQAIDRPVPGPATLDLPFVRVGPQLSQVRGERLRIGDIGVLKWDVGRSAGRYVEMARTLPGVAASAPRGLW